MNKLLATLAIGLLLLYFVDAAFHIDGLTKEMLTDNSFRFLLGFILISIWSWSEHKHKPKIFMYLLLVILIGDVIYDYVQNISTLDFEMTLHDLYLFFWGALSGYYFLQYLYDKKIIS